MLLYEIPTTDLELQNPLGNSTLCLFLPRKTSSSGASWDDDWTSRFSPHIPCTGRVLSVFQLSERVGNAGQFVCISYPPLAWWVFVGFLGHKCMNRYICATNVTPKKSPKRIHWIICFERKGPRNEQRQKNTWCLEDSKCPFLFGIGFLFFPRPVYFCGVSGEFETWHSLPEPCLERRVNPPMFQACKRSSFFEVVARSLGIEWL